MTNVFHCTIIIVLSICVFFTSAYAADQSIEYEEFNCRLTLPYPNMQWLDHSHVPEAKAMFGDDKGMMMIFIVQDMPQDFILNDKFIKGFDESFVQPGVLSKVDGKITTFQGAPCYHLEGKLDQDGRNVTVKTFAANGYMYILELISANMPQVGNNLLGDLFSAFEFTSEPMIIQTQSTGSEPSVYKISYLMGQIVGFCVVCFVVIAIIKWVLGKTRNKA